jgi:hypothetical protein
MSSLSEFAQSDNEPSSKQKANKKAVPGLLDKLLLLP